MGYKKDDPCLMKAHNDERLFVLMARDPAAPGVVIEWIKQSLTTQSPEKLHEVLNGAISMAKTQQEFALRKLKIAEGWTFSVDANPPNGTKVICHFSNGAEEVAVWNDAEGWIREERQLEGGNYPVIRWRIYIQ